MFYLQNKLNFKPKQKHVITKNLYKFTKKNFYNKLNIKTKNQTQH